MVSMLNEAKENLANATLDDDGLIVPLELRVRKLEIIILRAKKDLLNDM